MQETQTSDKKTETDTDFDSFREAETEYRTEVQHGRKGTARLESCELVDYSDIPDKCKKRRSTFSKKYLMFEATLSNTDKNVKVICPARDDGVSLKTSMKWAGAAEVSELAGRRVPITHLKGDYYKVEAFDSNGGPNLSVLPTNIIKSMVDTDMLEFKSGKWKVPTTVAFSTFGIFMSLMFLPLLLASLVPTAILTYGVLMIYPAMLVLYMKAKRS